MTSFTTATSKTVSSSGVATIQAPNTYPPVHWTFHTQMYFYPPHFHPLSGCPVGTNTSDPSIRTTPINDPFHTLSDELVPLILINLSSKDIANLRVASRKFGPLPDILFRHLIITEIPWFGEAPKLKRGSVSWFELYQNLKRRPMRSKALRIAREFGLMSRKLLDVSRNSEKTGQGGA